MSENQLNKPSVPAAQSELNKEQLLSVLNSSINIIQIFKAVRDKQNNIVDFIWIMNNEKDIVKNGDVIGKSLLQQNPGVVESGLFSKFLDVTETGRPIEHETYYNHGQFDGWLHVTLTKLNDGFVMHSQDITGRKKSEQEIIDLKDEIARQAEGKYRQLFNTIDEGFCIIKILFDRAGKPYDYLILEVNQAFVKQTGLVNATGKTMRELSAEHEEEWYAIYGSVALTGDAVRFEKQAGALGYYYDVYAFPVDKPENHHVAVLFKDISHRRKMETELRENDERQKFLLKLNDAIRTETSTVAIQETASRLLCEYLNVARVAYAELEANSDLLVVSRDWCQSGICSITGMYNTNNFGKFIAESFKAGRPVIVDNAAADPRISDTVYKSWESISVKSTIAYPIVKHSGLVAVFFIHHDKPKKWQGGELTLLSEVANRTWEAIERARAEEALSVSEKKYRELFDSMDEGYCIIKMMYNSAGKATDWRYLQVNRAFELNNGLRDAEGKTIKEMAPDIEEKWMEIYDRVAQTGEPLRFREDSEALNRIFNLFAFRIGEPEERKVAVIFTDITQQANAETALKESEEQFRTLTQSLPQLIWTTATNGYCDFFNQQWLDYTGATFDEVKGDGWIKYMNPEHKHKVFENWNKSLREGLPMVNEFQLRGKNGEYNWFSAAGNPVRDADGNIIKWVGALTNIEEQKEAELKLQLLVEQRTVELQRSNEDLQKFAHVASHDLSEPVRKIHMLADRLKEEDGDRLSENGRFYLERINSAAGRMSDMIDGVLQYSELTNFDQASEKVGLGGVIKKIEEDLELVIQQNNVTFKYDALPVINGVQTLIYQLFYNLVKNSVKFSRTDTAPVIAITSETFIKDNATFHKIVVADNGIGFSDGEAERIFNSFTRLHSKDKYEGTGLGLALCRNIAERHGGTITATGEKGKGAVFTIILPAG